MAAKRILYLHESALSPAEYAHYVESFNELVEGDRSQNPHISVREARGWLKGRYAANNTLDAATIDKILRLFYPQLAPADSLTAGQFYAVLRLIVHVQNGKEVDDSLVFSQPENWPRKSPPIPPRSLSSTQSHETRRRSPPPPLPPKRSAPSAPNTPKSVQTDLISVSATSEPPPTPGFHSNNPFANRATSAPNSAKHGSTLSSDEGSIPDTTARASSSPTRSPNPFINRTKSISRTKPAIPVPVPSPSLIIAGSTPVPPLPPRKSSILPPPRHASQQAGAIPTTNTNTVGPPPKPPKPPMPFPVSPLIKQGLLAAKGAQLKSEMSLDKLRTWEVIKTGGADTTSSKQRSMSPTSNATGRIRSTTLRRTVKSEDSRVGHSAGEEYEDDDRASTSTSTNTNTSGPDSGGGACRSEGISPSGTGTRLGRSKSLHQPSGVDLPAPPPRRQSVQLASPSMEAFAQPTHATPALSSGANGLSTLRRRSSQSHGIESLHKAVANMRPGFESARANMRPGFESARAKVEGKLIPGGYGKWREERLVDDGEEIGGYAPAPPSSNSSNGNLHFGGRGRSGNRRAYGSDAEEEEGVEDGWRPLRG